MASTYEETTTSVKESPTIGAEAESRESSESMYSNVQSSLSHGSELAASAAGSSGALSTEELLAAVLRMKQV